MFPEQLGDTKYSKHSLFSFQSNIHIFFIKNAIVALLGSKKKYIKVHKSIKKYIKVLWGEIDIAIPLENKITGYDSVFEQQALKGLSFLFSLLLNFHSDICCCNGSFV